MLYLSFPLIAAPAFFLDGPIIRLAVSSALYLAVMSAVAIRVIPLVRDLIGPLADKLTGRVRPESELRGPWSGG